MIREQSAHLAYAVNNYEQLILTLRDISHRFSCSLNKRRKKLNTVDQMDSCKA